MTRVAAAVVFGCAALHQAAPPATSAIAERVMKLTRTSPWTLASSVRIQFDTYHPQGMVKIGETLFVSSVEIRQRPRPLLPPLNGYDRDPGDGAGHLFKIIVEHR